MKKNLINYYAIIMLGLYLIYNITLNSLKIGGLLYQIIMIIIIIVNAIILIIFRKDIRYKEVVCVIYFFTWLFSKNILQCFFYFSNIIVLSGIGLIDSMFMRMFAIIIGLIVSIFFLPLFFIFLLCFGTSMSEESGRNDIYEDMHYYCENNYEVYSYSAGAMDRFHYSIGKHYEFLDIDGIIYISYNERNEVSQEEYNNYLNTHKCKLVGNVNESKKNI